MSIIIILLHRIGHSNNRRSGSKKSRTMQKTNKNPMAKLENETITAAAKKWSTTTIQ